jgi:hypothetical protein
MNTVFEVAVYAAGSLLFAALAYTSLSFYFTNIKLADSVIKLSAQLEALQKKARELIERTDLKNIESSEAFIGFVSQSRDKAFKYIEDVQSSMYQLKVGREALNYKLEDLSEQDVEILRNVIDNVLKYLPEDSDND